MGEPAGLVVATKPPIGRPLERWMVGGWWSCGYVTLDPMRLEVDDKPRSQRIGQQLATNATLGRRRVVPAVKLGKLLSRMMIVLVCRSLIVFHLLWEL